MQVSSSNPNSSELANESENARAALSLDKAIEYELNYGNGFNPTMDSKKFRRIMSNRLSAQRARLRKVKYVTELEKMVKHFEELISGFTSQMEDCKEKMDQLLLQNQSLQSLLELRLNEARFSESQVEKNKMEVKRLKTVERALYMQKRGDRNEMQDVLFMPSITLNYVYENSLQRFQANQFFQDKSSGEGQTTNQY